MISNNPETANDVQNVAEFLDAHINRLDTVPLVIFEETEYTNSWFRENANRVANGLVSLGITKGDKVAVSLQNCPEVIVVYQAVLKIGAVIVPIMFNFSIEETQFILNDSEAVVFMTDKDAQDKIQFAIESERIKQVIGVGAEASADVISYQELIKNQSADRQTTAVTADDIALLIYTAGTTGKPKGVMLSHGNLYHHSIAAYDLWDKEPRRQLSCLPLAHMFGVTSMLISLLNRHPGSILVLMPWFNPEEIFRLIEKYKISGMGGVPTMFWILLNDPSIEKYDLSSMDQFVAGAAPVPDELQKDCKDRLDIDLLEAYGLSESCSAIACTHHDKIRKPGSAGTPIGKAVIRIFDDEDNELPPGVAGEIVVGGPIVMKGYYRRPTDNYETLRGGLLHTGDMGYLDDDGYLFLTDRKKDMIIKGGENIYPSEVENIILKHPHVLEAAVIGIKDSKYGENVMAFVVTKPGFDLTEEEIITHSQENYTKFKCPAKVRFIDNLPKSLVGKILKKELRKLAKAENGVT